MVWEQVRKSQCPRRGRWWVARPCQVQGCGAGRLGDRFCCCAESRRHPAWLGSRKGGLERLSTRPFCRLDSALPPGKVCCAILVPGNRAQRGQSRGRWRRGFGGTRSRERKGGERPESIAAVCFLSTY